MGQRGSLGANAFLMKPRRSLRLRMTTTKYKPLPMGSTNLCAMPTLGDKLQYLATVSPRHVYLLEALVDRILRKLKNEGR